jgi:hypothetical protein
VKVRGDLYFEVSRFELVTRDSLLDLPPRVAGEVQEVDFIYLSLPIVYGLTDDGQEITLLRASGHMFTGRNPMTAGGWSAQMALIGDHLDFGESYTSAVFEFQHLDAWVGNPRPTVGLNREGAGSIHVTAVPRNLREMALEDGTLSLDLVPDYRADETVTVRYDTQFRYTSSEKMSVATALRVGIETAAFVRLGTNEVAGFKYLALTPATEGKESVELLMRTPAMYKSDEKPVATMPFSFGATPGGIDTAYPRWLKVFDNYIDAWRALTSQDFLELINPEYQLTSFARAIEIIHGLDFVKSKDASKEHSARIERVLAAVPTDDVVWAREQFEGSRPPIARVALSKVVTSVGRLGEYVVDHDPGTFAQVVVATRNGLTHPKHRRNKYFLPDSIERFWFARGLYWIAYAYLLQKLGMPEATCFERLHLVGEVPFVGQNIAEISRRVKAS